MTEKYLEYNRVSTRDQQERNTIQNQHNAVIRYAEQHPEIEIVARYKDEAMKGTRKDRPGFIKMLDNLGNADGIIAFDISRVSRDLKAWSYIMFELRDAKKKLIKVRTGQVDDYAANKTAILTAFIEGWTAENELSDISDRVKEGIKTYKDEHRRWGRYHKVIDWGRYDYYRTHYNPPMPVSIIVQQPDISDRGPISQSYFYAERKTRRTRKL